MRMILALLGLPTWPLLVLLLARWEAAVLGGKPPTPVGNRFLTREETTQQTQDRAEHGRVNPRVHPDVVATAPR